MTYVRSIGIADIVLRIFLVHHPRTELSVPIQRLPWSEPRVVKSSLGARSGASVVSKKFPRSIGTLRRLGRLLLRLPLIHLVYSRVQRVTWNQFFEGRPVVLRQLSRQTKPHAKSIHELLQTLCRIHGVNEAQDEHRAVE